MIGDNHKEDARDRSHGNKNEVFRDRSTVNSHSKTGNTEISINSHSHQKKYFHGSKKCLVRDQDVTG